jgi:hypothetical protein
VRYVLPLLVLAFAAFEAPAAEPLGRLFFTPAQRAQLDAVRSQKARAPAPEPEPEQEVKAPPLPEVITFGGIVRRSDGRTTVWINNRPIADGKAAGELPIEGSVRPDGSVRIELPQADRSVDLRVGQSVEIESGAVEEPYARSPIAVKPAARAPGAAPPAQPARKDADEEDPDRR